jgi:hypothetical protein
VLGKLQFDGRPLRDLLIEAIRYGDRPDVRARLDQAIVGGVDRDHLEALIEERALAHEVMDISRVARVREEMERAEARRLQPHYIESFFLEAFRRLGGTIRQRETRRYEITHVPTSIRSHGRRFGAGDAVLSRYERIVFEKDLIALPGQPRAAFICPGHPLLDAVIDLTLERHRDLLKRGTVLVDDRDPGVQPRALFTLEHAIRDAHVLPSGEPNVISRRMVYVEIAPATVTGASSAALPHSESTDAGAQWEVHPQQYAPYLDYRPLRDDEPAIAAILAEPECAWITGDLEKVALNHAIHTLVLEHIAEVKNRRLEWIEKTRAAVNERLTREIAYWDRRAEELRLKEASSAPLPDPPPIGGRVREGGGWREARRRADELQERLETRLDELKREAQIAALPPVVIGGCVVVPAGLLARMRGIPHVAPSASPTATQESAARARAIVMAVERRLGYEPVDRETERLGYDIESRVPGTGKLRLIEVKGRVAGAPTITVTRNEILTSLNKPDDYILAIVEFLDTDRHRVHYIRRPFRREPDFGVTSVDYALDDLLARAEEPA